MDRVLQYSGDHPWLAAFVVVTALAVLAYEFYLRSQNVAGIAPQEAIRLMNQGATVFDLRPQEAYAEGHIRGARRLDTAQVLSAAETLKRYKEKPLILYSDRSSISAAAVRTLARNGFSKVFNLRGGVAAWRAENLPLARD
jgi:rhodanese-related sulfurtransferase